MAPFQTARFIFRTFSWWDLIVTQNQRGNRGRRHVLLHQWEVVYRCNSVKEDVLFWSRNALHQLQADLLAAGVLFVHSRECLHSAASVRELYRNSLIWSQTQNYNIQTLVVFIIYLYFNKGNLSHELPKYRQHVTCPTRYSNKLAHCYTTIKHAYHSVPKATLGLSDHCLVHRLTTYRQMNQRDRASFTSLSLPYWLECFWSCCKWSGWAHRDCHFVYQFLWGHVHSDQDVFNLQQWQTMVHC